MNIVTVEKQDNNPAPGQVYKSQEGKYWFLFERTLPGNNDQKKVFNFVNLEDGCLYYNEVGEGTSKMKPFIPHGWELVTGTIIIEADNNFKLDQSTKQNQ